MGSSSLGTDWREAFFRVPGERLVRGENELCLRFTRWVEEEDGALVAALVEKIQLP